MLHLHPLRVREEALAFPRTFGLGGMVVLLIFVQLATGLLLRFYYKPFPGAAYQSILFLQSSVLFGQFIRNIHHWSGVLLVLFTFLHFLRTFFTGAFHSLRKVNWIVGLILFALIILSNFTGYLLPWDQLSYWAITVSTGILHYLPLVGERLREFVLAGKEVNADTLLIFYNLHTSVLPITILILMIYHFWRVRKAGGIMIPREGENCRFLPSYPYLVYREGVVALVVIALVFTLAVFVNAPLREMANPDYSPNPTKAPWYFAGIQEMLLHFHPFFAGILIPLTSIVLVAFLPFLKFDQPPTGRWFHSEKGKQSARLTALVSFLLTVVLVLLNEYLLNFEALFSGLPAWVSNGVIPLAILIVVLVGYYRWVKGKFALSLNEALQALFVFAVTALVTLTLIGIFFRGVDMELTFPWGF